MARNDPWKHFEAVTRPALLRSPTSFLADVRNNLVRDGIAAAVARGDTPWIFDCLISAAQFQGISDRNAIAFARKHGIVGWRDINSALEAGPACQRLRSYWDYSDCRYRKGTHSCAEPHLLGSCSVPTHPARKGTLTIAAYSLALFVRDICAGDLVGWIDGRLAEADPGPGQPDRALVMGKALLEPLTAISGIGSKVWSMALADILIGADPNRERWVTTGAAMVVVDTLLHNHLQRTGVLRRFAAQHPYGKRCYGPGGCADIIRGLADRIDARQFNPDFPSRFARFIQFAIWRLCSTSELNVCNGNQIDDRKRCANRRCPVFAGCDRLALHPTT